MDLNLIFKPDVLLTLHLNFWSTHDYINKSNYISCNCYNGKFSVWDKITFFLFDSAVCIVSRWRIRSKHHAAVQNYCSWRTLNNRLNCWHRIARKQPPWPNGYHVGMPRRSQPGEMFIWSSFNSLMALEVIGGCQCLCPWPAIRCSGELVGLVPHRTSRESIKAHPHTIDAWCPKTTRNHTFIPSSNVQAVA